MRRRARNALPPCSGPIDLRTRLDILSGGTLLRHRRRRRIALQWLRRSLLLRLPVLLRVHGLALTVGFAVVGVVVVVGAVVAVRVIIVGRAAGGGRAGWSGGHGRALGERDGGVRRLGVEARSVGGRGGRCCGTGGYHGGG